MSLDAPARIAPFIAQYRSDCHRETAAALLHGFTLSVGFRKVGTIGKVIVLSSSNDGGEFFHNLPPVGSGAGGDGGMAIQAMLRRHFIRLIPASEVLSRFLQVRGLGSYDSKSYDVQAGVNCIVNTLTGILRISKTVEQLACLKKRYCGLRSGTPSLLQIF
jgi:hypothetical protein